MLPRPSRRTSRYSSKIRGGTQLPMAFAYPTRDIIPPSVNGVARGGSDPSTPPASDLGLGQLFEERLEFGLLGGAEAAHPPAERIGEQGEPAGHGLSTRRRQRQLVAAQVGAVDLALYEPGRLQSLHV